MDTDEQKTADPKSGIQGRRSSNHTKGGHAKDKKKQDNGIERSGNIAPDQITTNTVLDNLNSQTELRNSKELVK